MVPDGFRIFFAGNIGASQDFNTILTAGEHLKQNKNIKWIILGDGRMSGWVQSEVNKRGLNDVVHLLGRYPVECMPRFFALADALLVTLKKEPIFALTIPSKVQTYLACGRPVIAGLDGEGARIIDEAKAGITCSAEDPVSLAKAVITLYEAAPDKREQMGRQGRRYFEEHFEREKLLDRLIMMMTELLNGGKV